MRKHAQPDFVETYGSHNTWQRQEKSTIRLEIDGQIGSKSVELFLQGFFSEGLKVDRNWPSITEARENNTKAPGQQNKKNSKRWVSCKNVPFQQKESFIGTSSMDSCGVFNRFRCCRKFSRHRNTRAWDSWPREKNKRASEQWRIPASGQKQGTAMVHLCSHCCDMQHISRISVVLSKFWKNRDRIKDFEAIKITKLFYLRLL